MVVDAFMWSYERDAIKIRLATLNNVVGVHFAVQATNTFRGDKRKVRKLNLPNVIEVVVTIPDGLNPWESEKWLRNTVLAEAVKQFGENELYMVSDGDEIPRPESIIAAAFAGIPMTLRTDYRNFFVDWRGTGDELAHQPTIGRLADYMAVGGAGDARWHAQWDRSEECGWHLSSLGGNEIIKQKLTSFAHTEYDTDEIKANLDMARQGHKDFLGRFELEYTDDIPMGVPKRLLGGKF
jgi:hypothetical protein